MKEELVSNKIKNEGFYFIPDFISENEVRDIKKRLVKTKISKGKGSGITFYNGKRVILNHLLNFKIRTFFEALYFINSKINKKFVDIANKTIEESYLRRIDSYISPIDDKPIIDWHNDTSYSGAALPKKNLHHPNFFKLRFFLYLTNVSYKNGSLALIPKSHIIVSALTQLFYENIIKYEPYWDLKSFLKLISKKEIKNKICNIIGQREYDDFLFNANFINKNNDTNTFDIESKAGGLIIFDDRVFHRGSSCLITDRSVMRFIFASKKFI